MSGYGWTGIRARHKDGREGIIRENPGWCWVDLHIEHDGKTIGTVSIIANGTADKGDRGWEWLCENFNGGPQWLPLGDFGNAK